MILVILWSRVFLLIISAVYLLLAYLTGEARIAVSTVLFLVWPFVFIWFADDLSSTTGTYLHYRRVSRVSPVLLVKLFGFVILLTPPVVALLYR